MFKRIISICLVVMMVLAMIPLNSAYAAPSVTSMNKAVMSQNLSAHNFNKTFNYSSYSQLPNETGPVYNNPTNEFNNGSWRKDTIDGRGVTRPGKTDNAALGFCVSLEAHKMLGAALKGQLSAYDSVYYDNYKGDDDYGKSFITTYNKNGSSLGTNWGPKRSVSNWVDNNMSISVPRNAAYVIFGAYGKRDGGLFNKDLDFNVNYIYGQISDYTAPYLVRLENDQPHMSADTEIIEQNTAAKQPSIYITMSEDCTFPNNMTVTLKATDKTTFTVGLEYQNMYNFNYSNGDVTYKFRIKIENINVQKHFESVTVNAFRPADSFGNSASITSTINKRIDTKAPIISNIGTPNVFNIADEFGISRVIRTLSSSTINQSETIIDLERNNTAVKVAPKNSNNFELIKKSMLTVENNTAVTDIFKVKFEAWDLVYDSSNLDINKSQIEKDLFLISNQQPVRFTLKNSDNPTFEINHEDVGQNAKNALTNMYLQTNIEPKYLAGAKVYYTWTQSYDAEKLKEDPASNNWNTVFFKSNSSETASITVPVSISNNGEAGDYLVPTYKDGGYLYVMPCIDDDSTNEIQLRAGSMPLAYNETESLDSKNNAGYFKLTSNPVEGEFVNRGCDCTGLGEENNDVSHYALAGNHTRDIGFDVTKNHEYLSAIEYYISEAGSSKSYLSPAPGTIIKNSTGKYDIPISAISNRTGDFIVKLVLKSNKGDVTVQEMPVKIESPIIGVSNVMYNQTTKNLDFTVSYRKSSIFDEKLAAIDIEFGNDDVVEFADVTTNSSIVSRYAAIEIENLDDIGSIQFVRTDFTGDSDTNFMKANFRASLTNMENAADVFIKAAGAKRVHLKYTTTNNVEVFNNNITVIKKTNVPPAINLIGGTPGTYFTSNEYKNSTQLITVKIQEPIIDLENARYAWVESANTSLIYGDGFISSAVVLNDDDGDDIIEFSPDITAVTGDKLYKPYYLAVYAENADKYLEKSFGPFYVLNDDINNKRFSITATDDSINKQVLIAVDDRLNTISQIPKADKVKVLWQKVNTNIEKTYDISFDTADGIKNVAVINIPYPELIDTDGEGGRFELKTIGIYDSANITTIFKEISPESIAQTLPEHFVTINGLNVKSDNDEIFYQWSRSPYEIPIAWSTTQGAIRGIDFISAEKTSIVNSSMYLFVKSWNKIYRSDKIDLQVPVSNEEIAGVTIKIGEAENGYFGAQDGTKNNVLLRIKVADADDIHNTITVKCYDQFSITSGTAIKVNQMFKVSDKEIAGLIPSLVTSGGAISCKVSINGFDSSGAVTSNCLGEMTADLESTIANRTIKLNSSDSSKYSLYAADGKSFEFNTLSEAQVYDDGSYLLVYRDGASIFAKTVEFSDIKYKLVTDIQTSLSPEKPAEGTIAGPVTATVKMPLGSVITDKYGAVTSVIDDGKNTIATAVITKSAIYTFKVKFANDQEEDYELTVDYIAENYTPVLSLVTSSSAITYNPAGPALTINSVTATTSDGYTVLNNDGAKNHIFDQNGSYSFILKDADNNIKEYTATVDWIDKNCPEPKIKKFVWYDFDNNKKLDLGEQGSEIPEGYKTKHNVIVEITFPADDSAVKLLHPAEMAALYPDSAYKFVMLYSPDTSDESADKTPDFRQVITFSDDLGNTLDYSLIINEIDRTDLLTQLNYSTTNYTNRDVVVSMSANKSIKRYDYITVADGKIIEKDASPTYVFKENGKKDFNYKELGYINEDEAIKGTLTANVTWIDKSVPSVKTEYSTELTNKSVEINFTVLKGVSEDGRLKYNGEPIDLDSSGENKTGNYSVYENGTYHFEVSNKYGNVGDVIVPIFNIDKEAPVISITGTDNVYVKKGDKYYDKGATALDNRDKDITDGIKVMSNVNTSIATTDYPYEVTYSITDASGNISEATRYVHVLNIDSAVAIVQNTVIDLKSEVTHNIEMSSSGMINVEFIGIDGSYVTKYTKGAGPEYNNGYFKTNGSYLSKLGTFTAQEGLYTLYVQDQERNTRTIKLNFTISK